MRPVLTLLQYLRACLRALFPAGVLVPFGIDHWRLRLVGCVFGPSADFRIGLFLCPMTMILALGCVE